MMVCFCLVGEGGFGPPKLKSNRFTVCPLWPLGNSPMFGAGDGTRTRNLLITNQLLCQLSYTSEESHQRRAFFNA